MVEAESGRVAITVHPAGAHLNPWGTVHGGLTATLLDSCMGLAIQSMLDKGIGSTTLEFKISLVRAITLETGQIRAEGKVLNCGRRVGTAEGRVIDAKADCSRTIRRRASFSRANASQDVNLQRESLFCDVREWVISAVLSARQPLPLFPPIPDGLLSRSK